MSESGELFDRWLAHRDGTPLPAQHAPGAHAAATPAAAPTPAPAAELAGPVVAHGPDGVAAGAAVLAALQAEPAVASIVAPTPTEPEAPIAPDDSIDAEAPHAEARKTPVAPVAPVSIGGPQQTPTPTVPTVPTKRQQSPLTSAAPRDHAFTPRRLTRATLTTALAGWVLASVATCVMAWNDRSDTAYAIAALVVLLTVVTWAVRAGTSVARLRVRGGILEIRRAGRTDAFSLVDAYQLIEVTGRPGTLRWRVRFLRPPFEPYVVDGSMVDPQDFMRVLTSYRPDLTA